MWLINTSSKELVDAASEGWPEYAILSHVWSKDKTRREVNFQDIQDVGRATRMPGFVKIQQTCKRALDDGYKYVWIDTCCINKQNNIELSEAINSMYRWYREAAVCYALLSDVDSGTRRGNGVANFTFLQTIHTTLEKRLEDVSITSAIQESEWFQRGWTLQELIAPEQVIFFDVHWKELGTRKTLTSTLVASTGIPEKVLNNSQDLSRLSIAQRMSWASDRKTTRLEDRAYSLLGILDINMPMLYGEGANAFLRLQEEILKRSDDHSIFSWRFTGSQTSGTDANTPRDCGAESPQQSARVLYGMLAPTPEAFRECREVRKTTSRKGRSSYTMSNRGLSISFKAALWSMDTYVVPLYCDDRTVTRGDEKSGPQGSCLALLLTRLYEDDHYARTTTEHGASVIRLSRSWWDTYNEEAQYSTTVTDINVPQRVDRIIAGLPKLGLACALQRRHLSGFRLEQPKLFKLHANDYPLWKDRDKIIEMEPLWRFGKAVTLKITGDEYGSRLRQIKVGFDDDCNPICFVATREGIEDFTGDTRIRGDEEEQMAYLGLKSRTVKGSGAWTKVWSRESSGHALELKLRHGLWALRGDRLNGINAKLTGWPSKTQKEREYGHVRMQKVEIERGERKGYMVWQLSLELVKDGRTKLDIWENTNSVSGGRASTVSLWRNIGSTSRMTDLISGSSDMLGVRTE